MEAHTMEQQKREGGFTLVELAIVMIIIGLLIGGILKGQELIANSQVTATISQVKGIDAAVSTFRDKYSALPGDMITTNRLANCAGAPCAKTAASDGRIAGSTANAAGGAPGIAVEGTQAFSHLSAADLLSGVQILGVAADVAFGRLLPDAKVGGGFTGIEYSTGNLTGTNNSARPGHYLVLNGTATAVNAASADLLPSRAAQIERKMDDGDPDEGSIRGTTGANCIATGIYDEANNAGRCALFFRIQG